MKFFDACADWLTAPVPAQPLAAFRVLIGLLLLSDSLLLAPDLDMWFTETGVFPDVVRRQLSPALVPGLFAIFGDTPTVVRLVHAALVVAALAITVGIAPRLAACVALACLVSFAHRNAFVLHSGDTFLRLMTCFMVFAPSDACYRPGAPRPPPAVDGVAFRVMQFQVCLVYATTGLFKVQGEWWRDGSAVYIVQQLGEFQRFPIPLWARTGAASATLTWGTLAIEAAFPLFVWIPPLRLPMLAAATAMHLGIEYAMNVRLFEWILMATFVLFLKPEEIDAVIGLLSRRRGRAAG